MSAIDDVGGWPSILGHLVARGDLTALQSKSATESILAGEATSAQIAAFLVGLRAKGETSEELGGMLDAVLAASGRVELPRDVAKRSIDSRAPWNAPQARSAGAPSGRGEEGV
ncbi:MAG: anthranilate phosphoribosyltransferase [Actinomycetota bacterium]